MIGILFLLVILVIVVYVLCLLIDWLCGQVPLPGPIPMILKLIVVLIALFVLYDQAVPLLGGGGRLIR